MLNSAVLNTNQLNATTEYDLDVILHDTLFDLDVILNLPSTGLPLYIGAQQVQKVYIGSQEVTHAYLGNTLIF